MGIRIDLQYICKVKQQAKDILSFDIIHIKGLKKKVKFTHVGNLCVTFNDIKEYLFESVPFIESEIF